MYFVKSRSYYKSVSRTPPNIYNGAFAKTRWLFSQKASSWIFHGVKYIFVLKDRMNIYLGSMNLGLLQCTLCPIVTGAYGDAKI